MTETEMNYNELFFREGLGAFVLAFAGVKLETFSQLASTSANVAATIVAITAIYTFIKKEIRERKKKD
jgi:hypothetical protein